MKANCLLIMICLATLSCGDAWVENYELKSAYSFQLQINPYKSKEIQQVFISLANEHDLEIRIINKDHHAKNAFHVMMRNRKLRVNATNLPDVNVINVAFYNALDSQYRLSETQLAVLGDNFRTALE